MTYSNQFSSTKELVIWSKLVIILFFLVFLAAARVVGQTTTLRIGENISLPTEMTLTKIEVTDLNGYKNLMNSTATFTRNAIDITIAAGDYGGIRIDGSITNPILIDTVFGGPSWGCYQCKFRGRGSVNWINLSNGWPNWTVLGWCSQLMYEGFCTSEWYRPSSPGTGEYNEEFIGDPLGFNLVHPGETIYLWGQTNYWGACRVDYPGINGDVNLHVTQEIDYVTIEWYLLTPF